MKQWTDSQKKAFDIGIKNNLLVSAAAGSGKTAVMIERISRLICHDNASLDKMIIVTYTNLAAASMKKKLAAEIEKAIALNPTDKNLARQRLLLDRSDISTLHAYCAKQLRRYYFRTPLPPDFRIISDSERTVLRESAIGKVLEQASTEYSAGKFPEYKLLLDQLVSKGSDDNIASLVLAFNDYLASVTDSDKYMKKCLALYTDYQQSANAWEQYLLNAQKKKAALLAEYCKDLKNKYSSYSDEAPINSYLDAVSKYFEAFEGVSNIKEYQECFNAQFPSFKKNTVKNVNVTNEFIKNKAYLYKQKKDLECFFKEYQEIDCRQYADTVRALDKLNTDFSKIYNDMLLERGGTDYNGILHYTVALLKENPDICNEIKANTDYIFVDEYQDISAYNDELISTLSSGNNVFYVGDIKQSIYGFQHAKPELFGKKMKQYNGALGELVTLCNNFRSLSSIIDGVNFIFENSMFEDTTGIAYDSNAKLNPSDDTNSLQYKDDIMPNESSNEAIISLLDDLAPKSQLADTVAMRINELLNSKISRRVDDEKKQATKIYDADGFRPIEYSDIVLLVRTEKHGVPFEKAFKKYNIPYSFNKSEITVYDPVNIMVSLLSLINMRRNDVDLIAVMASGIGNFTNDEMLTIRKYRNDKSYYDAVKGFANEVEKHGEDNNGFKDGKKIKGKIDRMLEMLDHLDLMSKTMALPDFIEYAYNYTNFIYTSANSEKNSVERLIYYADSYTKSGNVGIRGFLKFFEKSKTEDIKGSFSENSVRIMTIHKSKGLEFPIVILADSTKNNNIKKRSFCFDDELGIALNFKSINRLGNKEKMFTLPWQAITDKVTEDEREEEMRLLYVALTRAQSKFIFASQHKLVKAEDKLLADYCYTPGHITSAVADTYSKVIIPLLYTHKDGDALRNLIGAEMYYTTHTQSKWNIRLVKGLPTVQADSENSTKTVDFDATAHKAEIAKIADSLKWEYEYKASLKERAKQSPSKAHNEKKTPELHKPQFIDDDYTAAQKGTVMHFFMEHAVFDGTPVREQAERLRAEGFFTDKEYQSLNFKALEGFFESSLCKRMAKAEKLYRERSFCSILKLDTTDDTALAQGNIDCYFEEGDEIIIVDYKTDFINNNFEAKVEHHKPQMKIYKEALEKMYSKPVTVYLYFFSIGKEHKVDFN